MSRHKFEIVLEVDDDALAAHDENLRPPPKDIDDWEVRDIIAAVNASIVDEYESEVAWYDGVVRDES